MNMKATGMFAFTASAPAAQVHYVETMDRDIDLKKLEPFLTDSELQILEECRRRGGVRVWGAVSGPGNTKTWGRLHKGDFVFGCRSGFYEHVGRVVLTKRDHRIAHALWGLDKDHRTWEHTFFLTDIQKVSVPYAIMNTLLGYKEHRFPRGLSSIAETVRNEIIDEYGSMEKFVHYLSAGDWKDLQKDGTSSVDATVSFANITEAAIEDYLCENPARIEAGLQLVQRQRALGATGQCDMFCRDKDGKLVIVEIKRTSLRREHVAQLLSYMGYAREHLDIQNGLRGILITVGQDRRARYALQECPDILWQNFDLRLLAGQ